jgi:hypothetical protein
LSRILVSAIGVFCSIRRSSGKKKEKSDYMFEEALEQILCEIASAGSRCQ